MLDRKQIAASIRPWQHWIVAAIVLLTIAWWVGWSQSFQSCINQSNNKNAHEGSQKIASYFSVEIGRYKRCLGEFILENEHTITALSALAVAIFTATLWWATSSVLSHGRQIERAYVTGGFGKHDPPNRLFASIHNNGKTPAIVDYLFIDVCPLGKLPPVSEILTKRKYVNYSVPPLTRIVGIDFFATWNGAPDHIFFGRFWYTDIFGDTHESGFALHLGKSDGMPAADAPEYWKWT
jgi:hypothetical protein